jgi:hypothetical protein
MRKTPQRPKEKTATLRGAKKAATYRREAQAALAGLREPQLRVARDFLSYLRLVESNDPTLEIMANQQMMDDVRTSRADWRAERRSRFTPLEKLKRHA